MNCILISILLVFCVLESKALSKYKEDAQSSPFRMNKINQIWQKAQKVRYSRVHTLAELQVKSAPKKTTPYVW